MGGEPTWAIPTRHLSQPAGHCRVRAGKGGSGWPVGSFQGVGACNFNQLASFGETGVIGFLGHGLGHRAKLIMMCRQVKSRHNAA